MHATPIFNPTAPIAVDLAKDVFQLAFAAASGQRVAHQRLSRAAFSHAFDNAPPLHMVMEACGSAHYWARHFQRLGHTVTLLPVALTGSGSTVARPGDVGNPRRR